MTNIEAKNAGRLLAVEKIQKSFFIERFDDLFISEISALVLDDVHLSGAEIKRRDWQAVYADDNGGAIDIESDALVNWCKQKNISPIYATSRQRLVAHIDNNVLVMKLTKIDTEILNQIDLGMWMFGDIPELASQRISDWRADIWFTNPLQFIVLSEHDGYGTTTIAGPAELIASVKAAATHGEYTWKDGVVPDWNKGAMFPETTVPPDKRAPK